MLEAYEWNAMIPLPTAAELLATTPQTLLTVLANQAHRIDGDHPVFGKKHPVMVYFFADDCDPAYPVPVVGRPDGPNKRFLFALAANGAAQLPPPFDSPPRTVKRDEACLMAHIVRRLRDLMTAPTPEAQEARPELKVQTAARRIAEIGEALADRHRQVAPDPAIPAPNQDNQAPGPLLIGTTYYTGRKDIMAALGVSTWKTVKNHMASGLVITHNPAKKPQTTQQEIDRWRASGTGKEKK